MTRKGGLENSPVDYFPDAGCIVPPSVPETVVFEKFKYYFFTSNLTQINILKIENTNIIKENNFKQNSNNTENNTNIAAFANCTNVIDCKGTVSVNKIE